MTFALGSRAAERGYRVAAFDTLDSTNAEAMRCAQRGEAGPLWIVTHTQTAGRGRRGRTWHATPGDLAASLLIAFETTPPAAATLGFVAGIALHDALQRRAPGVAFALKWPNDVLGEGRKVAGILLESESLHGRLAVVIGIGVNVVSAPADVPFPATSLAESGATVNAATLFAEIADCWTEAFEIWDAGRGLPMVRDRWLARAAGHRSMIAVRTGDHSMTGLFETLDERGNLVLRRPDGTCQAIAAGDVYFGDAATQAEAR